MERSEEVRSAIGSENYTTLIDNIAHGFITKQNIKDISLQMGPTVHGVFVAQTSKPEFVLKDVMRMMLDQWFLVRLFKDKNGTNLLKEILMHEDIRLLSIADKLKIKPETK